MPPPPLAPRTERLLGALALALLAVSASTFLLAAAVRLAHPYEIEWLESEMLQHVHRVLAGQPLYAAPSAEFSPTIYPPGYAWVSAAMARVAGATLLAPRLVSVLSTLGMALLAFVTAGRLSGSVRGGFFAAALLLSGYVPCGTYLDLARVDSFWVLLLLLATALAARAERPAFAIATGVVLALAALTKQPSALFALVLAAVVARRRLSSGILLLGVSGGLAIAGYLLLHAATAGWSTTYLITMPLAVPHRPTAFVHLLRDDCLRHFAPAAAILLLRGLRPTAERGGQIPLLWWAALAAALASTASMRTLQGGGENTLLPMVAFGAVLAGAAAGLELVHGSEARRRAVLLLLLLQAAMLFYSPRTLVPGAAARASAERFVERIRAIDGPVWVASHTSYAWHAGKPWIVHRDPLLDITYTGSKHFPLDLVEKLRQGAFAAVVLDGPFDTPEMEAALAEGYELAERLEDVPVPLVGYRTRPALLYRPRRAAIRD